MNEFICNVLYAERFDFEDSNGKRIKAGRLYFTDGEIVRDKYKVGLEIKRVSCDYDILDDLNGLIPGEVKLRYKFVNTRNGLRIHVVGVDGNGRAGSLL